VATQLDSRVVLSSIDLVKYAPDARGSSRQADANVILSCIFVLPLIKTKLNILACFKAIFQVVKISNGVCGFKLRSYTIRNSLCF
jgi:hypothetical protein